MLNMFNVRSMLDILNDNTVCYYLINLIKVKWKYHEHHIDIYQHFQQAS